MNGGYATVVLAAAAAVTATVLGALLPGNGAFGTRTVYRRTGAQVPRTGEVKTSIRAFPALPA